jgi:hypothetical protein
MKNYISIAFIIANILTGQAFAQSDAETVKKLAGLATYGNDAVGKYPLCNDVIKTYPNAIDWAAFKQRMKSENDLPADAEYTATYEPKTSSSNSGTYYPVGGGTCFSDETIVTIAFPAATDVGAIEITMEDLAEKFDDEETQGLHILSSVIEVIPDATTEFKKPCWAAVSGHTLGELYDKDDSVCKITYGSGHQETCTPKHRFRVEICDNTGKVTGCEWKAVSEIDKDKMHLLSDTQQPIKISSITTEVVDDWDGGWFLIDFDFFSDLDVHNLSVATGTYFVGEKANRVLVHNVKP